MTRTRCNWFWGSHGCDLPLGHEGVIHLCGGTNEDAQWDTDDNDFPCSQYDSDKQQSRSGIIGEDETFSGWGQWWDNKGWQQ